MSKSNWRDVNGKVADVAWNTGPLNQGRLPKMRLTVNDDALECRFEGSESVAATFYPDKFAYHDVGTMRATFVDGEHSLILDEITA